MSRQSGGRAGEREGGREGAGREGRREGGTEGRREGGSFTLEGNTSCIRSHGSSYS